MLNKLFYDDGGSVFQSAIGKTITALSLNPSENDEDEDRLRMTFSDGSTIAIYGSRQLCCEHRYMHTDDDLSVHIGATLVGGELRDGPEQDEGEHDWTLECQFLLITTSRGVLTVANYNHHNGNYGGFALRVIREERTWNT